MNKRRIKGVFFRYYYAFKKGPHQITDLFYFPLVDILLWGLTSVWIQTHNSVPNLPLVLMTALIFWQIAWRGSVDITVNLLQEFWQRNLVNLFATPLTIAEWSTGILILSFCKLLISVAFGTFMVWVLYALNVFTIGWIFLPFAVLLLIFGWALGFLTSGMIVYWGHKVEILAFTMAFIFAPFSAVFYPVEILPIWAEYIAWSLPTTYVFEGMRLILAGQALPMSYLWISLVLNIVFLTVSIFFFRWMFEKSRDKGLARLE